MWTLRRALSNSISSWSGSERLVLLRKAEIASERLFQHFKHQDLAFSTEKSIDIENCSLALVDWLSVFTAQFENCSVKSRESVTNLSPSTADADDNASRMQIQFFQPISRRMYGGGKKSCGKLSKRSCENDWGVHCGAHRVQFSHHAWSINFDFIKAHSNRLPWICALNRARNYAFLMVQSWCADPLQHLMAQIWSVCSPFPPHGSISGFAPHFAHKSFPFFHFSWIQLRACFNATRRRHKIFINFPHGRMSLIRSCKLKHALFGNHHNWTHNLSEFNEPARARHGSHDSFSHRASAAIRIESIILLSQRAVSRWIPGW